MSYFNCKDLYEICPCLENLLFKNMTFETSDGILYEVEKVFRITEPGGTYASKINAFWRYGIQIKTNKTESGYYIIEIFGFRLGPILYKSIQTCSGSIGPYKNDNNKLYLPTLKLFYDDIDPFKYQQMSTKQREESLRNLKAGKIERPVKVRGRKRKESTSGN